MEGSERLEEQGIKVNTLQIRQLHPSLKIRFNNLLIKPLK